MILSLFSSTTHGGRRPESQKPEQSLAVAVAAFRVHLLPDVHADGPVAFLPGAHRAHWDDDATTAMAVPTTRRRMRMLKGGGAVVLPLLLLLGMLAVMAMMVVEEQAPASDAAEPNFGPR